MEAELIITEVKKRPVIWDSTEECYKNKAMKYDAWMDVAATVEPNFKSMTESEQKTALHEISMKWRSIRDNYVRYKKKISETSGGKPFKSYIYSKQLRFLNKSIYHVATPSTPPITTIGSGLDTLPTPVISIETFPDFPIMETEDNDTTTCSYSLPPKKLKIPTYFPDTPLDNNFLTNTATSTTNFSSAFSGLSLEDKLCKFMEAHKPKEFNEDMLFFESLLPTIKILSNDEKLEFRIRTLQLLQEIKRKRESLQQKELPHFDTVKIKEEIP